MRGRRHIFGGLAVFFAATALLATAVSPALAAVGPKWKIDSLAVTSAEPGETLSYGVDVRNVGDEATSGPITVRATLPVGLTAAAASITTGFTGVGTCKAGNGVDPVAGASSVACTIAETIPANVQVVRVDISVTVGAGAAGTAISQFEVTGGGASPATTVDPTRIEPPPGFGIDAFDNLVAADEAGTPATQAGSHPYSITTDIDFNAFENTQPLINGPDPFEAPRDVFADLPPGLVGNPSGIAQCSFSDLLNSELVEAKPECSPASQVGGVILHVSGFTSHFFGPLPVFNLVPPPGAPARFGFNILGTGVVLDAGLRSDGDYGLTVASRNVSEALGVAGVTTTFWGVPSDESHRSKRACPGQKAPFLPDGPNCASEAEPRPFLRLPTACTTPGVGLNTSIHIDSWNNPGAQRANRTPDLSDANWHSASATNHEAPGYPYLPEEWGEETDVTGCDEVPFEPSIEATPSTNAADSPSGLEFNLTVPQDCWEAGQYESICPSDLREAEVTLPEGMSVNPSSAGGLGACSPSEIGLTTAVGATPAHFDTAQAKCPDASRIGEVSLETPLLEEPLKGSVFLAAQNNNPFNAPFAMYMVLEGSGVIVKQAGEIIADPQSGRLRTRFDEVPQAPFSKLRLELFGGPRAPLRTPPTCGTYTTEATLTPWSGNPASQVQSSFAITGCPNSGFNPRLSAGTANALAATYSPFVLRLGRDDGSEEISGLSATLPEGLIGKPAGVAYCPEAALAAVSEAEGSGAAQIAAPSCPASSLVGTVTVGAGAGPNPFYVQTGRAYLAGPYKGAPLSLAVIAPAVAGPFDLGSVLVRNALRVDPETARLTAVSDPLPTILHGIPLDLRDIRVEVNRPQFTLNPTSCDPMAIDSTIASTKGKSASPASRFQVTGCEELPFKPKLSLSLKGKTRRGSFPALKAVLTMPPGSANIASARVTLSHANFIANAHIGSPCTRVQFAANACPPSSVLGKAKAETPLLDAPLEGPIYLMSGFGHLLPDLALDLGGQIHVFAHGKVDTGKGGGIRSSFEVVPDAPVSKITLNLLGKKKGLLELSENVCAKPQHALAEFTAHNNMVSDTEPLIRAKCPKQAARHKRRHG